MFPNPLISRKQTQIWKSYSQLKLVMKNYEHPCRFMDFHELRLLGTFGAKYYDLTMVGYIYMENIKHFYSKPECDFFNRRDLSFVFCNLSFVLYRRHSFWVFTTWPTSPYFYQCTIIPGGVFIKVNQSFALLGTMCWMWKQVNSGKANLTWLGISCF